MANFSRSGVLATLGIGAKHSIIALRAIPGLFFAANFSHFRGFGLKNPGVGFRTTNPEVLPNGYNPNQRSHSNSNCGFGISRCYLTLPRCQIHSATNLGKTLKVAIIGTKRLILIPRLGLESPDVKQVIHPLAKPAEFFCAN